jgi:hypothetical protein
MGAGARRILSTFGAALAAAALLFVLQLLAARITAVHFEREAGRELYALQQSQPLWSWHLHEPRDLVAGRVFGAATLHREAGGLRVVSLDGSPFELGLPVAQPLDLAHWPRLRLTAESDADGALGALWQAHENTLTCETDLSPLRRGARETVLDLRTAAGHTAKAVPCPAPATVAYMLRLRIRLPAGATLLLRDAALLAQPSTPAPATAPEIVLPPQGQAAEQRLAALERQGQSGATPILRLPAGASTDTWLALRDRARLSWPAAMILPAGAALAPRAPDGFPARAGWSACAVYVLGLVGLSLWLRRRDARPGLECAAILAGPLWLIAGLQWGLHLSLPALFAFAAALIFAAWLEWRRRPGDWRWTGCQWQDWAWPLALVPVAGGLVAAFGHALAPTGLRHALTYVGWAVLQQWLMLAVVLRRLEQLRWPRPAVWLATAALFALFHTPNGPLMQLCLLAELWWAWGYVRSRCLLPVALAHAACALLVEAGLAGTLLRSLEISGRYFL